MTTDVPTTPRKKFSPTQRLRIFEQHGGRCALCKEKITDRLWIVEHLRALGLGGSNEPENLAPAHSSCADLKTHGKNGDNARIAKAKRQKIAAIVPKEPRLKGAPFPKREKPSKIGRVRIQKAPLPPRRGI